MTPLRRGVTLRRTPPFRRLPAMLALALVLALALTLAPGTTQQAVAAGERVDVWLTTTSDTGGRNVTRGLAPQTPVHFGSAGGGADQTITVDETTTYQQFEGGGASITDTTAHLLRGGAVSASTRDAVMRKLFSPTDGIGLSFVRNPIGASDLSRPAMSRSTTPAATCPTSAPTATTRTSGSSPHRPGSSTRRCGSRACPGARRAG